MDVPGEHSFPKPPSPLGGMECQPAKTLLKLSGEPQRVVLTSPQTRGIGNNVGGAYMQKAEQKQNG